jgi:hypothetical protein
MHNVFLVPSIDALNEIKVEVDGLGTLMKVKVTEDSQHYTVNIWDYLEQDVYIALIPKEN